MSIFVGTPIFAYQVDDLAKTADTTLEDTDLVIPIAANERMHGYVRALVTLAGTASGAKFQLTVPAGGIVFENQYIITNGGTGAVAAADTQLASAAFSNALANADTHALLMHFEIENGATAGNVALQFAQLVSDAGAATFLLGATMMVWKF